VQWKSLACCMPWGEAWRHRECIEPAERVRVQSESASYKTEGTTMRDSRA
jgi:hypothetical protein